MCSIFLLSIFETLNKRLFFSFFVQDFEFLLLSFVRHIKRSRERELLLLSCEKTMMTMTTVQQSGATKSSSNSRRNFCVAETRGQRRRRRVLRASSSSSHSSSRKEHQKMENDENGRIAIVFGATGGVGQLVCAKLLDEEEGRRHHDVVYAMCRNKTTGEAKLTVSSSSSSSSSSLRVTEVDVREEKNAENALRAIVSENEGKEVDIVCCLGTTAFPSARWKENNGPEQTDDIATANVIRAAKNICFTNNKSSSGGNDDDTSTNIKNKNRFVLISSVGVTRTDKMPYVILNLFGVLKYKRKSEKYLEQTQKENGGNDFDYTIIRPGRLTDGPYTSYDLNTLLKATSSERRQVEIKPGDDFDPMETSRIAVADCAVFSLRSENARNKAFVIGTKEGDGGPGQDEAKWKALFDASL